jgi:ABC-type multidrug transport system fused ATPase/permease subunit
MAWLSHVTCSDKWQPASSFGHCVITFYGLYYGWTLVLNLWGTPPQEYSATFIQVSRSFFDQNHFQFESFITLDFLLTTTLLISIIIIIIIIIITVVLLTLSPIIYFSVSLVTLDFPLVMSIGFMAVWPINNLLFVFLDYFHALRSLEFHNNPL